MPVTFIDNSNKIKQELTLKIAIANRMILEDIHKESLYITPMKSSQLRRNVTKTVTPETYTGTIIWREPYASYQERGSRYDGSHVVCHYTTPGTGKDFAKKSVFKSLAHVDDFYQKIL